ncbi:MULTISPECIES: hypothetical protein [unclassified Moorena]|uniref:hypothetical protein n=1 Tax=unclassified Moorena TaxID=2683338 RepID=UPI0013B69E20|nr:MULTISPECIES: hypothetical protein [unclassified Moorena]NEO49802.1 hypothetical protein [Moorena sp. SIO4A3]NEQ82649.1 hypothetical protein [Moorena sp. SIO2I5]NEO23274.1 hypothetical protein [Moorena sp. SIO4A5]NEP21783.1 hypothetical protein [Moorena sp. SIO3I6]NEQ59062.1 hypothetical protein [Moorena sp. SIO4A1]
MKVNRKILGHSRSLATLREQLCGTGFGLGLKATRGAFGHAVRTTLGLNVAHKLIAECLH